MNEAKSRVLELRSMDAVAEGAGIRVELAEPGRVRLAMRTRPDMGNGLGLVHGGWIFLLADTAFAYASATMRDGGVTTAADIVFHAAGRVEDTVYAEAIEQFWSGAGGLVDVVVSDSAGRRLASLRASGRVPRS